MSSRAQRWLWVLAILAILALVLGKLVCGVYRVDTPSMEPTIFGERGGSERVLVVYDRSAPARFDPVVVLRPGEERPLVKRAAGLPGERVQLVDGDLLVGGARLGPDEPRPRPIPVFDERWQEGESAFPIPEAQRAFWTHAGSEWTLVARTGTGARATSRLEFQGDVKDSYLDAAHALVQGEIPVNDLVLELELAQDEPGTRATLALSEAGDLFELALERTADGKLVASLLRRGEDAAAPAETLATRTIDAGAPGWHRLRFSNIDNALVFERDGARVLVASYAENRFAREDRLREGRHRLPRAAFGGSDGMLHFRALALARDLFYTQRGEFAVGGAKDLGLDGYLLLGDNSSFSRDGREWGETRAGELVGRPVWIVWPLSGLRRIEGAVPPAPLLR